LIEREERGRRGWWDGWLWDDDDGCWLLFVIISNSCLISPLSTSKIRIEEEWDDGRLWDRFWSWDGGKW